MAFRIFARFKEGGTPKAGLSPVVNIYNATLDETEIPSGAMTELGSGYYFYDHDSLRILNSYLFSFDGGSTLTGIERYLETSWVGLMESISEIPRGSISTQKAYIPIKEFEKLKDVVVGVFGDMTIEAPELNEDQVKSVVKNAVSELEEKSEKALAKLSEYKPKDASISKETLEVFQSVINEAVESKVNALSLDLSARDRAEIERTKKIWLICWKCSGSSLILKRKK